MARQVQFIHMVEGDTLPVLACTFTGVDITGYSIVFRSKRPDGTVMSRAATITAAATGEFEFRWQTGDIAVPGVQQAEIEVTTAAGKTQTFQGLALDVRRQIG
jgi:hypothetical protein